MCNPRFWIGEIAEEHSQFGSVVTFSGEEVKADLYREANEFCAAKGKDFSL